MLVRFWVEGYRCFGKRLELDLTDKKNYRFGKECVRGDFLDKIVILGGNNVGKTSFGFAITDIVSAAGGFTKDIGQYNPETFLNVDTENDRATFHYEMTHRGSLIVYEYSRDAPDRIVSEALTIDHSIVFRYDLDDMGAAIFDETAMEAPIPDGVDGSKSVVSAVSESARLSADNPISVVRSFAEHTLYYMAMWKMDTHIGLIDEDDDVEEFILKNGLIEDFTQFLRDVCSVDVELVADEGRLYVVHGAGRTSFRETVSRGTMLLGRLFCWTRRVAGSDGLVFFDDFDDMFHYQTAEDVIKSIISRTMCQCIFVTHNAGLVSNDFLRPDCCFIMDGRELKSLSSLVNKDIRRGHNLEKMLRGGEFSHRNG